MARTDAIAVEGFEAALERAEAYMEAGADMLFVEAPQSLEELHRVAETFRGARLVANMVEDGLTPYLSAEALQELGFTLAIYPVSALLVVAHTLRQTYGAMHRHGNLPAETPRLGFKDYNAAVGLDILVPSAAAQ